MVESLDRANEADHALLREVLKGDSATGVSPRNEVRETQVGLDHLLPGLVIAVLDAAAQLACLGGRQKLAVSCDGAHRALQPSGNCLQGRTPGRGNRRGGVDEML